MAVHEEDEYPQYDHACFYGCMHPDHGAPMSLLDRFEDLKDKLFEFKDLLCWFSENGYDISEIGGDSFAVTANYSRFDTGTTFHVGPGGVMQPVER